MDEHSSAGPEPIPTPANVFALARTKLANQRTFLSYFRTANGLFASAVGLIKLIDIPSVELITAALVAAGTITLGFGVHDFLKKRRLIADYAHEFVGDVHVEI